MGGVILWLVLGLLWARFGPDFSDMWDRGCESAVVAVVGIHGCGGGVYMFVVGCGREA